MFEIKINIEAPALVAAISQLAGAIAEKQTPTARTTPKFEIAHAHGEVSGAEIIVPAPGSYIVTEAGREKVKVTDAPAGTPPMGMLPDPEPEAAPEKPKRKRTQKAAEKPAEAAEAPQADSMPAEPQDAQESAQEAPVSAQEPEPEKPTPTLDQIANAGAALLDTDIDAMMPKLLNLLQDFGVQAITQLKPEQLPAFAERLRALGAEV